MRDATAAQQSSQTRALRTPWSWLILCLQTVTIAWPVVFSTLVSGNIATTETTELASASDSGFVDQALGWLYPTHLDKPGRGLHTYNEEQSVDQAIGAALWNGRAPLSSSELQDNRGSTPQSLSFWMPNPPGTLDGRRSGVCGTDNDDPSPMQIPDIHKMLVIIGTQKGGTTFLWNTLTTHKSFLPPVEGSGSGRADKPNSKEVHFFDQRLVRSGQIYLDFYTKGHNGMRDAILASGDYTLLDASPEYMNVPSAAPRLKAVAPHAKIVAVLRDPVMRALSAIQMRKRKLQCKLYPAEPACRQTAAEIALMSRSAILTRGSRGCFFPYKQAGNETFGSCGCGQNSKYKDILQRGNYAVQLGWWLSYFPPSQLLIIPAHDLREEDDAVRVLNNIRVFAGLEHTPAFTKSAFAGRKLKPTINRTDLLDPKARMTLREFFEGPTRELQALMDTYFPSQHFSGLRDEV